MRVAITVDDLPGARSLPPGMAAMEITRAVLEALKDNDVAHACGFATGSEIASDQALIAVLKMWLAQGYPLGNHTFSHMNLDDASARDYITDIGRMQTLLASLTPAPSQFETIRFFRYPYLAEGSTLAKRNAIRHYLSATGYQIAEVTIDYYDWAWNNAYLRCLKRRDDKSLNRLKTQVVEHARLAALSSRRAAKLLFGRDIAQILLVHDTVFDSITLGAVLTDYRRQGVRLISLDEALNDPVYKIDPKYAFDDGLNFLAQVAASRKLDIDFGDSFVGELNKVCQ